MIRPITFGLVGAVVLTTSLTGVGGAATAVPRPSLEFGPCPDDISRPYPDMQCATLDVPLDHSQPDGETVELLVSKLPATDPGARRGVLFTNPGGPGGPGVDFAGEFGQNLPPEVRATYDLIGFDTRHTAHSTAFNCVGVEFWKNPMPDPDAPQSREAHWNRAQQYADGCRDNGGKYLPHLTTPNNARDMDAIRAALGEERINYVGYSYGTYLGATYGELFPERVDRFILDSAVNSAPENIWYQVNLKQDVAAQERLDRYFDWIARYDAQFRLGTDREQVRGAWNGILADLRKQPHGTLGPWELIDITFNALYGDTTFIPLAEAMRAYRDGDDTALVDMVPVKDKAAENVNTIYNAVECADAPWPTDKKRWEDDAADIAKDSPLVAWFNSWGVAPCRTWHAPHQEPVQLTGEGLPPVLMFNSEHDVATPIEGAQEMHQSLPSSVMVTEQDAGKHGIYLMAGNAEADRIGTEYLLHGTMPEQDVEIPGHPLPDPTDPRSVREVEQQFDLPRP